MIPNMKRISSKKIVAMALVALLGFIWFCGTAWNGTLASLKVLDGSEYKITQTYNWSFEPYTVDFFMRGSEGPWGWSYVDHQAKRWKNVTMVHDTVTDCIVVTENGTRRVVLNRHEKFIRVNNGTGGFERPAPQWEAGKGVPSVPD